MQTHLKEYSTVIDEKVVWGEMDAFQHVNNTVYFRYFESVRIAYFERIGAMQYFEESQIGPILASTTCDYRVPLTYPDNIKIAAKVDQIWEKRFNMQYLVYSESLDKVVAQGAGMVVYVDYHTGKSCAVPGTILTSIRQIEKSI